MRWNGAQWELKRLSNLFNDPKNLQICKKTADNDGTHLRFNARHATPAGTEGQTREVDAPDDGTRHPEDQRRDLVTPHLGHRESLQNTKVHVFVR